MAKKTKENNISEKKRSREVVYFDIQKYPSLILSFIAKIGDGIDFEAMPFAKKISLKSVCLSLVLSVVLFFWVISFGMGGVFTIDKDKVLLTPISKASDFVPVAESVVNVDSRHVKAVYLTMSSVSSAKKMEQMIALADSTAVNAFVIDVKGSQGELIYEIFPEIKELVIKLHQKNIYLIARVVVFQDSGYAKSHPELALKNMAGSLWRDRRGFAWLDPSARGGHEHIIDIVKKTIDLGFDEIQYDYVRFPTDGDLSGIVYPEWDGVKSKNDVLRDFFSYSRDKIKKYNPRINTSIDIFGYTFLSDNGLGIGQVLGDAIENFDFISPMVYPSHYSAGNFGFSNPADHPYEVVFETIKMGLENLGRGEDAELKAKIRPWLQVFDMGAKYDSKKIKAQIQAVYDSGSDGWLLWDPKNMYNGVAGALEGEKKDIATQ